MITVLVVGGMAIPAVRDITESDKVFTNTGVGYSVTDPESAHTLILSVGQGGFELSTDGGDASLIDGFLFYAPDGKGIAPAVGIGVYESYNNNGTLVSQYGVMPTVSQTMDSFRTLALNNNVDNAHSAFQPWNWFNYTMYKLMATTIMGNTDSQYMFGMGKVEGTASPNPTGLTTSAYTKAPTSSDSVCLLLENSWGSAWDSMSDTYVNNRILYAGNTLGGHNINNGIDNVLSTAIQTPTTISRGYILNISQISDVWGVPTRAQTNSATDPGTSINDCTWTNSSGMKVVSAGAIWQDADRAGLYALNTSNAVTWASNQSNTRLSCYLNKNILDGDPYGYILSISNAGVVSDVSVKTEDGMVSVMPTGTDINEFWQFDSRTGLGPFNCYYVAMNMYEGDNYDDASQARLSKEKGAIAYVLNPNNLRETLDGYAFNPTLYNIMLIVPTMYWYSDGNGLVYMGSSPDIFDGITMTAYGHNFTKGDETGNVGFHSVQEFAYGEGTIVSISDTGDVEVRNGDSMTLIGSVRADSPIQLDIVGTVLYYGGTEIGGVWAYRNDSGDHVLSADGQILDGMEYIFGAYGSTSTAQTEIAVDIGYVFKGDPVTIGTVSVIDPVAEGITPTEGMEMTDVQITHKSDMHTIGSASIRTFWSDGSDSLFIIPKAIIPREFIHHNDIADMYESIPLKSIPIFLIFGILIYLFYSMRRQPF